MTEEMQPTTDELRNWLLQTLRHSMHVEYFLDQLKIVSDDPERPHDLVGVGNKFERDVARRLALGSRDPKPDFLTYIKPALDLHRQQHHHLMWNEPDKKDPKLCIYEANFTDMILGAIDSDCSLLENRGYQGGMHDYEGIREVALKNPPHKTPWMLAVIPLMQSREQPKLESITDLYSFPNIGVPDKIYKKMQERVAQTIESFWAKDFII
ncbi:MAG: hypothetical protein WCI72_02320 [archaeon]